MTQYCSFLLGLPLINKWNLFQFDSRTEWSAGCVTERRRDKEDRV